MSKFKEFFKEWVMFDDGHTFVISAEDYTKEQALLELEKDILTWPKYQAVRAFESDLKEDRVQFKFGMDQDLDFMGHPMPKWYLGSSGKRSKKVWVIDMWDTSNFNQNTK